MFLGLCSNVPGKMERVAGGAGQSGSVWFRSIELESNLDSMESKLRQIRQGLKVCDSAAEWHRSTGTSEKAC